jgi:hypothetical protein
MGKPIEEKRDSKEEDGEEDGEEDEDEDEEENENKDNSQASRVGTAKSGKRSTENDDNTSPQLNN